MVVSSGSGFVVFLGCIGLSMVLMASWHAVMDLSAAFLLPWFVPAEGVDALMNFGHLVFGVTALRDQNLGHGVMLGVLVGVVVLISVLDQALDRMNHTLAQRACLPLHLVLNAQGNDYDLALKTTGAASRRKRFIS